MKGCYIFLAPGYEPLEALAPMDVLHRAKVDVKFVSLSDDTVVPSTQGYGISAELCWKDFIRSVDRSSGEGCMIFPGGLPGADSLGENRELMDILTAHFDNGGLTCAICAAPARVLGTNLKEKLAGRKMTVYSGFENELERYGAICTGKGVEQDGNLITAKGPGLALEFGLAILERLVDYRVSCVVRKAMML